MTEPRLSTVFDYSSLLLHPDGTRVYQKPTARAAVRTSRNHWVAKDAGGLGKIHKFKRTPKEDISRDLQEDEEFDGLSAEMDGFEPEDKGKVFEGQPSSDLLKCIHRYASEYYTESGQLLNISRDYRKQKKKRRMEKERQTEISTSLANSRTPSPNDDSLGSEPDTSTQNDYENESGSDADRSEEKTNLKPQRKGRRRIAKQYRDMYKVFDGSVMMAIGMLVQEYIAEVLDPQPPSEWEEEMHKAFTTSGDEDASGADTNDAASHAGKGRSSSPS